MPDIALSDEPWTPIAKFGGSFDGDGHTVSGMTIGTSAQPSDRTSAGFFETLANRRVGQQPQADGRFGQRRAHGQQPG